MRHIAKRIVAVVLAMMMVLSLVSWASAADYADMPTNWAKEPMEAAVENGLLQGNNGLLNPNGNLTRAQMAAIVVRAFGMNYYDDLADFTDVKDTDWFVKDNTLGAAYIMGLFQGNGDGRLTPNTPITREAAFAVLARALKLEAGTADDLSKFSDAGEVSSWFVGEVAAMAKAGYVNGNDGKLNPKGNITRAQFAQVMFNIFGDYVKEEGTVTEIGGKSVVISADGVTLKGVNVKGDVIIGEGVAEGDVYLDNVKIDGRLIVRGGGINSVHIIGGSSVANIIVAKVMTDVRIVTEGETTSVGTITVVQANSNEEIKDGNVIIEGAAETVVANSTSTIKLANAKVETVEINAKTEITADNSEIGKATVAAEEAYLTLTNGSFADEVVVTEAAKDAVVNVDAGTTIGKLETSANMTLAGAGTVEEEIAKGDVEIKKEAEVVERPEEGDSRVHVHKIAAEGSYTNFDDKEHYYTCAETKDGKTCGEIIYEAHSFTKESKWLVTKIKTAATDDAAAVTEQSVVEEKPADAAVKGDAAESVGDVVSIDAVVEYTCAAKDCGATKGVSYSLVTPGATHDCGNHTWAKMTGQEATDAGAVDVTCDTDGKIVYACTNTVEENACEAKKAETVPATGHRFDKKDATASTAPTCKAAGADVYVCINPGCDSDAETEGAQPATKSITLAATGNHDYTKVVVSADGSGHKFQCSTDGCDAVKKDAENNDVVEDCTIALRTIWKKDADVVTSEPTGEDAASWTKIEKAAYCTVCGWQSTELHTHAYTAKYTLNTDPATKDTKVHVGYCVCGASQPVDGATHTYNTATAESAEYKTGKCTLCGTAHTHGADVSYDFTAGSAEDVGVDKHIPSCDVCGKDFSAAKHNYDNGTCSDCDAVHECGEANAENAAKFTFTPAEEEGKHIATCKTCGKAKEAASCADTNKDDGKCDLCGAVVVTKTACAAAEHDGYLSTTATLKAAGTHVYTCKLCGPVEKEEECSYAAASEGKPATGKCEKCGTAHTHTAAEIEAIAWTKGTKENPKHTKTCATCKVVVAEGNCTPDADTATSCGVCGGTNVFDAATTDPQG